MQIARTAPDVPPIHRSGERITNWQLGRIVPLPDRVPENWELVRLTSIARLESGHTPARNCPQYWDGDVPWISLHDTDELNSPELHDTGLTVSQLGLANSSARLLPRGTVVFSRTATVGKCTIMGRDMATSQDFANYVCGPRLNNRYLMYLFRYMGPEWERVMAGSTHNTIYMPVFQHLAILLPPRHEQEAIAGALGDADALIGALEQLAAKKRQLKLAAMQELLTGKRRLPGFASEWKRVKLGEIGETVVGLTYSPMDVRKHGVLVLRASNIQNGVLAFDDNVFVEMELPGRVFVRAGDILICVRNGSRELIGKCALVDEQAKGMVFGAFMAVFRTPFYEYVFQQFQSDSLKRQIHEHLGATINQITNKSLNAFEVQLPSADCELTAIANILRDMDTEIAAIDAKLAKARLVKQGMMQELLTGRIRLVKPSVNGTLDSGHNNVESLVYAP